MARTKRGTLVAGAVTSVTVETGGGDILIQNLDASAAFTVINCRVGNAGSTPTDPVAGGADGDIAVPGARVVGNPTGMRSMVVKLICSAAVAYSVEAVDLLAP